MASSCKRKIRSSRQIYSENLLCREASVRSVVPVAATATAARSRTGAFDYIISAYLMRDRAWCCLNANVAEKRKPGVGDVAYLQCQLYYHLHHQNQIFLVMVCSTICPLTASHVNFLAQLRLYERALPLISSGILHNSAFR
jgi:hypothetical protein